MEKTINNVMTLRKPSGALQYLRRAEAWPTCIPVLVVTGDPQARNSLTCPAMLTPGEKNAHTWLVYKE